MNQLATAPRAAAEDESIRPFHINVPEAALVDLRQRIAATRWPDKETVADQTNVESYPKWQTWMREKPLLNLWCTPHL